VTKLIKTATVKVNSENSSETNAKLRWELIAPALILTIGALTMFCGSADLQMVAAYNPAEAETARALALLMHWISPDALGNYFGAGALYLYATSLLLAPISWFSELSAAGYTAGLRLTGAIFLALAAWLILRQTRRTMPGSVPVAVLGCLMFFPVWLSITGSSANSLTTLLAIPALLACLKLLKEPGPLPTAAAGLFAGLAFGSSFVGFYLAAIAAVVVIISLLKQQKPPVTMVIELFGQLGFIVATFIIGALIAAPQLLFAPDVIPSLLASGVLTTPMNPLMEFTDTSVADILLGGGAIGFVLAITGIVALVLAQKQRIVDSASARITLICAAALILLPFEIIFRSGGETPSLAAFTAAFFPLIICLGFIYRTIDEKFKMKKLPAVLLASLAALSLIVPSAIVSGTHLVELVGRGRGGDLIEAGHWLAGNFPKNATFFFDIGTWVPAKFSRSVGRYGQKESEITRAMPDVIVIHSHYLQFYSNSDNKPEDFTSLQLFLDYFWFYMRAERGAYPEYTRVKQIGPVTIFSRR
jgi:hypothetical protein